MAVQHARLESRIFSLQTKGDICGFVRGIDELVDSSECANNGSKTTVLQTQFGASKVATKPGGSGAASCRIFTATGSHLHFSQAPSGHF